MEDHDHNSKPFLFLKNIKAQSLGTSEPRVYYQVEEVFLSNTDPHGTGRNIRSQGLSPKNFLLHGSLAVDMVWQGHSGCLAELKDIILPPES